MNATITRLAMRAVLGRRRAIALAALPVIFLLVCLLVRSVSGSDEYSPFITDTGLSFLLPLVALLATTGVLAPEIEDGSIVYLLSKPVSRYVVGISKYLVAVTTTVLFGAVPVAIGAWLVDSSHPKDAAAHLVGGMVASLTYCALFMALSAWSNRAVVVGLLYVLLWEGILGGLLSGIAKVSVDAWARAVVKAFKATPGLTTHVSLTYALIASAVLIGLTLWITGERLRSFSSAHRDG